MSVELPTPYDYCYEWDGPYGKRKFTAAPHNGRDCDRAVPLFTADQMHAYAARVRAEAMEQCATRAVIHSMYPIESDFERGYDKGRRDAAEDILSLINKASEEADSKEKQG